MAGAQCPVSQTSMTNTINSHGQLQLTDAEDPWQNCYLDSLDYNDIAGIAFLEDSGFFIPIEHGRQVQINSLGQQSLSSSSFVVPDATGENPTPKNVEAPAFREPTGLTPNKSETRTKGLVLYSYYQFLTIGNIHTIPYQDVNYLESQGCLHVPNRSILEVFLRSYFMHVHVFLPLIDEGDFWDMFSGSPTTTDGSKTTASLLVLQAMIFSTCNFVPLPTLQELGYHDVSTARTELYRKTKLANWYEAVNTEFPVFKGREPDQQASVVDPINCTVLYTNLMYIYYYTSCITLCNREIFSQISQQAIGSSEIWHEIVRCVLGITECIGALTQYNLMMYLPVTVLACLATPLALYVVTARLSSLDRELALSYLDGWSDIDLVSNQSQLDVLIEAVDSFFPGYTAAQWVKETAKHAANRAQSYNQVLSHSGEEAMRDWVHMLKTHPSEYLRLTWTVDLCISRRKLPESHDFPICLRNKPENLN
ncbi:uncharacterized protein FRV6_16818 [Fusarium oxysporum]|uniref:Transcription factor domain-containing protein n=1 Tax=Fusarium oxysporum TaxID=5507 RepID=A0A2H3U719_FUSOX|nr:uncharacterized protein FRV6_16818 [Fusarium oxysporum]